MEQVKSEIRTSFIKGAAFAAGIAVFGTLSFVVADALHSFNSGDVISASQINANFNKVLPVGGIGAWHKNLAGVPTTLPDGWLECNGQVVSDSESPINGTTLPNLNGSAHFLRGSTTSGTVQTDSFQGHYHAAYVTGGDQYDGGGINNSGSTNVWATAGPTTPSAILGPITDGTNGTPRTGTETRPVNMSVVWIIRIK